MNNYLSWFKKHIDLFFLFFLFGSYFGIGIYLARTLSITLDEIAHLAAAFRHSQHIGLNPEHPVLLKFLNSFVFAIFRTNFDTLATWQYTIGEELIRGYEGDPNELIFGSRIVYLIFNSVPLIGLWLLYKWGFLKRVFVYILLVILVFSPSLYAHNYLITYDVAGSLTALLAVVGFYFLVFRSPSDRIRFYQLGILTTVFLSLALLTKFSNLVLVLLFIPTILVIAIARAIQKDWSRLVDWLLLWLGFCLSFIFLIWFLYTYSFGLETSVFLSGQTEPYSGILRDNITLPFEHYLQGAEASLLRSDDQSFTMFKGQFEILKFGPFAFGLLPYKENPGLFLGLLIAALGLLINLVLKLTKTRWVDLKTRVLEIKKIRFTLVLSLILGVVFLSLFPLIYLRLSYTKELTIGYRHFYPFLVFLYALLAWLIFKSVKLAGRIGGGLAGFFLGVYVFFGFLGVPLNISYTNQFWTEPRWQLVSDSSYNWGQDARLAYKFALDNNLLLETNQDIWLMEMWGNMHPEDHIYLLTGSSRFKTIDFNRDQTDLNSFELDSGKYKYLMIDSFGLQWMYNQIDENPIAKENYELLMSLEPLYNEDEVVWIYKLD